MGAHSQQSAAPAVVVVVAATAAVPPELQSIIKEEHKDACVATVEPPKQEVVVVAKEVPEKETQKPTQTAEKQIQEKEAIPESVLAHAATAVVEEDKEKPIVEKREITEAIPQQEVMMEAKKELETSPPLVEIKKEEPVEPIKNETTKQPEPIISVEDVKKEIESVVPSQATIETTVPSTVIASDTVPAEEKPTTTSESITMTQPPQEQAVSEEAKIPTTEEPKAAIEEPKVEQKVEAVATDQNRLQQTEQPLAQQQQPVVKQELPASSSVESIPALASMWAQPGLANPGMDPMAGLGAFQTARWTAPSYQPVKVTPATPVSEPPPQQQPAVKPAEPVVPPIAVPSTAPTPPLADQKSAAPAASITTKEAPVTPRVATQSESLSGVRRNVTPKPSTDAYLYYYRDGKLEQCKLSPSKRIITIGRHSDVDVQITKVDQSISRWHATITTTVTGNTAKFLFKDTSTYGSYVNNTKVSEHELHDRDKIYLGTSEEMLLFIRPNTCDHPVFEGPVWKHSTAFHKSWQSRWMCLSVEILFYFHNKDDPLPAGCIDLHGVILTDTPKPKNSFSIVTRGKPYAFYCKTPQEKLAWMGAIDQAIARSHGNPSQYTAPQFTPH